VLSEPHPYSLDPEAGRAALGELSPVLASNRVTLLPVALVSDSGATATRLSLTASSRRTGMAVPKSHPLEHDHTVGELLTALGRLPPRRRRTRSA
jgi:hypothetical protein